MLTSFCWTHDVSNFFWTCPIICKAVQSQPSSTECGLNKNNIGKIQWMFGELTWFKLNFNSSITLYLLYHLSTTTNHNSNRMAGHGKLQRSKINFGKLYIFCIRREPFLITKKKFLHQCRHHLLQSLIHIHFFHWSQHDLSLLKSHWPFLLLPAEKIQQNFE